MPGLSHAYHVSPTARRDTVRADGIGPQDEGDDIWLYSDRAQALREGADAVRSFVTTPDGSADVWQVDLTGIDADLVPGMGEMEDVTVALENIPGERFTLVETF